MGHPIEIACCDPPNADWLAGVGFPVHALGPATGTYGFTPRLTPWLVRHAPEYDGVVVNGMWQYHSLAASRAMRKLARPYLLFTHGMLGPWFKERYPLKHVKKVVYWLLFERLVLSNARFVLFTNEEERLQARGSFWPYHVRERVVSYGTKQPPGDPEIQRAEFADAFPQVQGKRSLLFLSRIHPVKGCDLLIKAFAAACADHPNTMLIMAGPDQMGWEAELRDLAKSLGANDRILWPGLLSGTLKWGAYHTCEAFVLPSHHENFGIVVAEALACGKPVLVTDKVNIWREVVACGAGLVDEDTESGITRLLSSWLASAEDARCSMSAASRRCFDEHFEIGRAATSLLDALQRAGRPPELEDYS